MKVTFLVPPVVDNSRNVDRCFGCNYSIYFLPLLPVLYMATLLKQYNKVTIMDFPAQKKTKTDFEKFISADDSEVYIFYTVFLSQKTDLLAREMIRKIRGKVYFVFCGPQPTNSADLFLDKDDTFCVRGEPEFVTLGLIRSLNGALPLGDVFSLSFRKDEKIIHNPAANLIEDIDSLPIPDRTLLDHKFYYNPKLHSLPHTAALTSRGCFGRCWFCVPNSLSYARELEHKKYFGRKPLPRIHSAVRVIEEFREIAGLGFKSVSIIDDEFLWDEKRTLEICRGIADLKLEWSCLARPDKITQDAACAMKEAGCAYVDLGTESFDEEILKAIRKDMVAADTEKAVRILKRNNLEVEINVLLGATPRETEKTIRKTLNAVKRINADYCLFSIANPFPGTDFYYAAKKEGWMYYGDYIPVDPAKNSIISYAHLSKKKLEEFVSYAYLSYYFRPRYLFKQLLKIKSLRDLYNKFSTAVRFFAKNLFFD